MMKLKVALVCSAAVLVMSSAFADVTTCNLVKITKNLKDGTQATSQCTIKLDSSNLTGSQGSGGIAHDQSLGTLASDCQDLPLSYDQTGALVPVQVYKQGEESGSDIANFTQFITQQGYLKNGNLGFDLSKISKLEWAAGGQDLLVYFYTAYDSDGNKLGTIFFPMPSMKFAFQGCYTNLN